MTTSTSSASANHASHIKKISNLFVNYYYTTFNKSPDTLPRVYSKNAKLTHTVIPEGVEQLRIKKDISETVSCTTADSIKKFYESSNFADSKICIHSIDHQSITGNSVLITTTGLIALTDNTPVYTFIQTFVLTPENDSERNYLIANDIFRLIPSDEFESDSDSEMSKEENVVVAVDTKQEECVVDTKSDTVKDSSVESSPQTPEVDAIVEPNETKEAVKEEPKPEIESSSKDQAAIEPKTEVSKTESPKSKEKTEQKQKSRNEAKTKSEKEKEDHKPKSKETTCVKTETKQEQKTQTKKETEAIKPVEKEQQEEKQKEEAVKENKKVEIPQPTSWASLVGSSAAPENSITQSSKPKVTKQIIDSKDKASSPLAKQPKSIKPVKPLANITNSQKPSTSSSSSSSSEKGHRNSLSYGVVLNNVNDLKGHEIKDLVEREIGLTTKVEPKGKYCTIAFETAASQQKALQIKNISDSNGVILNFTKITNETNFKQKTNGGGVNGASKAKQSGGAHSQGGNQRKRTGGTAATAGGKN